MRAECLSQHGNTVVQFKKNLSLNHLYVFSSPSSILNLGVQPRFNILDESSNFLGFPSGLEASKANSPEKLSKFFIFSASE